MAIENAKMLNVRIKNKYDSYENWAASGLVLEAGEIAIAYTTVNVSVDNGQAVHPALLMKVGNGTDTFKDLPWMSAKAADVLSVCKDETSLTQFVNSIITNAGVATDDALKTLSDQVSTNKINIETLQSDLNTADTGLKARVTTAEQAIAALEGLVGDDTVADQIDAKIAALQLAETYDAIGAAAAAETAAKEHANGLDAAMNTRVLALEAIDHEHTNKTALDSITDDKVTAWDAAEQNAKDYADGLDEAMDERVQKLEDMFGEGDDTVAAQIAAAVAAEAALREEADNALQDQIGKASEGDAAATGLHADIEALQSLVGDKVVATAIEEAVAAEAAIARDAEKKNADAIKTLNGDAETAGSVDYKIAQAVAAIMENPDETMNSINELVTWVNDHAESALAMSNQVSANKGAIETLNGDTTVEGSVDKKIADAIAAEDLAQYASGEDLEKLDGRVKVVEDALNTESTGLKARMTAAEDAIDDLEALVGDSSVQDQIDANLKVEAEDGTMVDKYALATDLAATNAEVEKKANDADLAAIAKTGSTDDLVQGQLILVFDCGSSAV